MTDGIVLLGDNTGCAVVILQPVGFQCAGGWISSVLCFLCIYIWSFVYSILTCSKFNLSQIFENVTNLLYNLCSFCISVQLYTGHWCYAVWITALWNKLYLHWCSKHKAKCSMVDSCCNSCQTSQLCYRKFTGTVSPIKHIF